METRLEIGYYGFMTGWCILPSFFWLRGLWKNNQSDRRLGAGLLIVFAILSLTFSSATYWINIASLWVFSLGIVTLVLGGVGKRMLFREIAPAGFLMILAGVMMALML